MRPEISILGSNIFYKTDDFCSLCFKAIGDNFIRLQDEISVDDGDNVTVDDLDGQMEKLCTILSCILGTNVFDYLSELDPVCPQCTSYAITSFKFINTCKKNFETLTCSVECLEEGLQSLCDVPYYKYKTVFLSVNPTSNVFNKHYDRKHYHSTLSAFKRFKSICKFKHKKKYESVNTIDTDANTKYDTNSIGINNNYKKEESNSCDAFTYWEEDHEKPHIKKVKKEKSKGKRCHICSICGNTYKYPSTLRKHEDQHNTRLECPICKKVYKHEAVFKNHVCGSRDRSLLQKTFTCDVCGKQYVKKGTLRNHIRYNHNPEFLDKFKCTFCKKNWESHSALKAHLVVHTKEKNFKCDICGNVFVSSASLLYHTRLHTGEKPIECKLCDQKFINTSRRADHVRRHHSAPSIECNICHKKFKGHGGMNRHKRRHFLPGSSLYMKTLCTLESEKSE